MIDCTIVYLMAEVMDLLIQVQVLLLQLAQRFVLSSQSTQEVVPGGVQQVLGDGAACFRLLHRTERTRH